jgi:hypothetical protein
MERTVQRASIGSRPLLASHVSTETLEQFRHSRRCTWMHWMEIMTIASSGLVFGLPALLVPFLVIYLVHDFIGRRDRSRDPLLGSKLFTTMIMSVGVQLVLAGVTFVGVDAAGTVPEELTRTGAALALAGVLVAGYPALLYAARLRGTGGAPIGRQVLGLNTILVSLAFAGFTVWTCQAVIHESDAAQPAVAAAIYGVAMVVSGFLLQRRALPSR